MVSPILIPYGTDSNKFRPRGVKSYGIMPAVFSAEIAGSMHGDAERFPAGEMGKAIRVLYDALRETAAVPWLHGEKTGTLWNRASEGLASGRARVAVGTGIAGHVAKTGEMLNVPDAYEDARFSPETDRETDFRTRSILCAPLLAHGGKLLGVIQVLNKKSGGVFTSDDEALMAAFASHAAIALDRGQLVDSRIEKERIEEGLRRAQAIQMAMLPRQLPARPELDLMAAMRPARSVGGDLYDFFVEGDRLWFLVGDVSGKGVGAALFMARAKTLLHFIAREERSPAVVLARVNAELSRENESTMFVTASAGYLDLATGRLTAANAGHPLPYHLDGQGAVQPARSAGRLSARSAPLRLSRPGPHARTRRRAVPL